MKKNTIKILTIISVIVSIIQILLSYFGIFRYISLHMYKCSSYVNNYKNIKKHQHHNSHKVIVVMTATEDNINNIEPTINSIFDQTVRVDEITLAVPYKLNEKIPEHIKNTIWVHNFIKDYGDLNAFIEPLLKSENRDDIIIVVQNNMIYGRDFIEEIIDENKRTNKIVYGKNKDIYSGILLKQDYLKTGFEEYEEKDIQKWLNTFQNVEDTNINYMEIYKKW